MSDKYYEEYTQRYRRKCRHYSGTINPRCAADVHYIELAGPGPRGDNTGYGHRLPCNPAWEHDPKHGERVTCERYAPLTDEEWAAKEAKREAAFDRARKAGPLFDRIRRENKGRSNRGSDPCPACGNGTIMWSIAGYNGHIHARCSTAGCISFMQ